MSCSTRPFADPKQNTTGQRAEHPAALFFVMIISTPTANAIQSLLFFPSFLLVVLVVVAMHFLCMRSHRSALGRHVFNTCSREHTTHAFWRLGTFFCGLTRSSCCLSSALSFPPPGPVASNRFLSPFQTFPHLFASLAVLLTFHVHTSHPQVLSSPSIQSVLPTLLFGNILSF